MKNLLTVEELTKSYGDRLLMADVTFGVNEGDKIGIIAKNGTGKTTLLNLLTGKESPDSGKIVWRNDIKVGYLEQTPSLDGGDTAISACLSRGVPQTDAIIAYEAAIAGGNAEEINKASEAMDTTGAWDFEERVKRMLTQLEITDVNMPVSNMSGGQTKRVAIARLLLSEPDFMILDEPTNHLDISVIEWLESTLKRSRVTLLLVTHDRYFLDRVCNKIIELDRTAIYSYDGGYDLYLRRRAERIEALTGELAKVRNTLRKEQEWMRRQPQARAGKAKYRIDRFYDLKERSQADYTERNVNLDVRSSYIGSKIFEARHVTKRFGDKTVLDDFNYVFARYERVGIVGANGVGKSTFIKMLQGLVTPDSGTFDVGETVRFGYYSQEGISLPPDKKVIDAVRDICEDVVVNGNTHFSPMQFLQRFLFSPPDQQKFIEKLSGGERARLHLATVLMRQPNFLVLDEPTNDLDIVTLGLLEEYLAAFKGCLIVVSHDRFFLDSIVDHLFVMEGNGVVRDFPGSYTDYREWLDKQQPAASPQAPKTTSEPRRHERQRPPRLTYAQRKELEELESRIPALEEEIAALDALFSSGEEIPDIAAKSEHYSALCQQLDHAETRWLELSEIES